MPDGSPNLFQCGPLLPDLPAFNNPGLIDARNVTPRTIDSYAPFNQLVAYSSSLPKRCQGMCAFIDNGGNVFIFAGTASDLYLIKSGSTNWVNVSKSPGAYNLDSGAFWGFTYNNGAVIATDFADNPQAYTLGSSLTFADLAGGPPRGRYIATVKNAFVVFANTFDLTYGQQPQRVWWGAAGSNTLWPAPGSAQAITYQSSYTDMLGDAGWVQGICSDLGNADAAIFMERAIKRMIYVGPPQFFDFLPAQGGKGTPAPNSIVQNGDMAFYIGIDGIYKTDGAQSMPVGDSKVDKTFFDDLDPAYVTRICGTIDPINKIIIWAYPGQGNSGGVPNHLMLYNWAIDRFAFIDTNVEACAKLVTIGYTLDQLYTVLGYTLDNLPAPLDSRVWTGGSLVLGLVDNTHTLKFPTGPAMAATITTAEREITPGRRSETMTQRVYCDGGVPSVSIGFRNRLQDTVQWTSAKAMNSLGTCGVRKEARYMRGKIIMPAGSSWNHIQALEIDANATGDR